MTTLTIVIPTTGRETLERAVSSAWATADDVIVVADGCRTDAVKAKIRGDWGAPGWARNAAIPHIRTEWVGFLDDDDVLVPDAYRQAVEAHQACDIVITTMDHPEVGLIPQPKLGVAYGNIGISFAVKAKWWRDNPFIAGQPRTIGEDYELVQRAINQVRPIVMTTEVGYIVRPEVPR
jgi:glycosyltransferase involved in cell wall biosynthesis